jgi:hypothetical protein
MAAYEVGIMYVDSLYGFDHGASCGVRTQRKGWKDCRCGIEVSRCIARLRLLAAGGLHARRFIIAARTRTPT